MQTIAPTCSIVELEADMQARAVDAGYSVIRARGGRYILQAGASEPSPAASYDEVIEALGSLPTQGRTADR